MVSFNFEPTTKKVKPPREPKISYIFITPRLKEILQCTTFIDLPLRKERSRSKRSKKRSYLYEPIGKKGQTPCRLELSKYGVARLYVWNTNYKKWIIGELKKHKVPEKIATQTINIIEKYPHGRGDITLPFLTVPPDLYGKTFSLPGLTVKLGDESHRKNVEIEVDFSVKREISDLKVEILNLTSTSKEIKESIDRLIPVLKRVEQEAQNAQLAAVAFS